LVATISKGRKGQVVSGGFGKGNKLQGIKTTQSIKKSGCSILKNLIEQDRLLVPDVHIIEELMTFVAYSEMGWRAEEGHTDDLVMCLVFFAWLCRQTYFKDMTSIDIRKGMGSDAVQEIENDLTPFGFVSGENYEENQIIDESGIWKPVKR